MKDFSPISLCNVIYKLISKTMANRIKSVLHSIIAPNQSAFILGRLITDNFLIAFEIFHHMNFGKGGHKHMALKLDLSKAYDRVEWSFLSQVMRKMGFGEINRIEICLKSVSFSILINGKPSRTFIPERGLRQGDPLSPYLFLLCGQALSDMMNRDTARGLLSGVRITHIAPEISHLLYANDCILFAKADEAQVEVLKSILAKFEKASGQRVNLEKTSISFSKGTKSQRVDKITEILGVRRGQGVKSI
ncbi:LOW QUALITY PROTEIN: hypothetical protein V2J09_011124 [Rumex salicifolius]